MRITRLRLTGFKSFVEPTELRIDPGLTGIVGPNGCGKSNLLEAIRWVMGESSARSMRGAGMEDVIFAGTATRPARDFAEVTLVCDSEGAPLPGLVAGNDGGALEIVRRIERGAGSAYRANGQDARARDVALIFADAATGAHSPALVSQGKVAAIIAAKPQDRRLLLEEAAGIAGLHARRKDAEQKLRATETNLARLSDLLADMEARAGALRRQARAAERYTRLTEQIGTAEARMIFARWREAATAADAARAQAHAAEGAVEAARQARSEAEAVQVAAMAALAEAREGAATEREEEQRLSRQLTEQRAERQTLQRRIAELAAETARIARDREAEDTLAREGADAIRRLNGIAREAGAANAALTKERPALEQRLTAAADAERDAQVALAGTRGDIANENAERRIAEAAHGEAARRMERITRDLDRIERDLAAAGDGAELSARAAAAARESDRAEAAVPAIRQKVELTAKAVEAGNRRLTDSEAALAEARTALATLCSEAAALEQSLATSAGDAMGVIHALRVAEGYEAALAAALGDDLSVPLGKGGWTGAAAQPHDPPMPDGLIPLITLVEAPPELARRLAQVGVTERDEGQALAVGQRLVTIGGALRRWDGFRSEGGGAAAANRLARVNRLAAVNRQLPDLRAGLERIEAARDQARDEATRAESEQRAARAALDTAEQTVRAAQRAQETAEAALTRHRAARDHVEEWRESMAAEAAEARTALDQAAACLAALPDGRASADRLSQQERETASAQAALTECRAALSALDRSLAASRERQVEAQAELRGWEARVGEAARRLTGMDARAAEVAAESAALAGRPQQIDVAVAQSEAEREAARARLEAVTARERTLAEAARQAETALETARERLAGAREARAGAAARADSADARRVEMGRISGERFACPPPLLPTKAGFAEGEVGTPQEESGAHDQLSRDRERIGPVNLVAAQDLAGLEEEQTSSAAEATELAQAVNRLRGFIGHLNREGRQRLLDAFEQVDGHFRRLFETLFGGGQAHLALIDADDPLEAGLEIMVQPPGKKLATLTLLSGGEQALTAVALIFALFLTNPAPICVLDEVDAPLDDANVERFCDLLDRMVRETATRYLIVTHNAVTMARMHRLFGVTMVEPGVSRLVSVDLGGAEELLAAE